ncbi:unnamed protein product [Mycena citricolor]|uniref:Uncharacterized protein n=1 Tax=Mycena citricolor TaxID=2018698 RepID=A0AAD2Q797_9AGAR|nr:unnamed protein product [Mycena citricolor]
MQGILRRGWTSLRVLTGKDTKADLEYYELVPPPDSPLSLASRPLGGARWSRPRLSFRRFLCMLLAMPVMFLAVLIINGIPSTYSDIKAYERQLPQHNATIGDVHDGRRYLRFPGHLVGHGWNNVLQEAIVAAHLAHITDRVYVFEDYTWSQSPFPYTVFWPDLALRPSRIPLNAFLSGPLAGGASAERMEKRAVDFEFFEQACGADQVHSVHATEDTPAGFKGASAMEVVEWWVEHLKSVEDVRCVEIVSEEPVFDSHFFGSHQMVALLPSLFLSPILREFTWSPLVQSAVARNFAVLRPLDNSALYPPLRNLIDSTHDDGTADVTSNNAGLVAVHLRQGDYERHCPRLALYHSTYLGINTHPDLPDRFVPGTEADYMPHCFPTVDQLVQRLEQVRADHAARYPHRPPLKRVFVLTNARGWLVRSLEEELKKEGWTDVWSSYDLLLDSAQKGVAMAVDMALAEGAEVFLGNGFSSLTGNIVMLRLARGLDPESIRFL